MFTFFIAEKNLSISFGLSLAGVCRVLMLAALMRRTARADEAIEQLDLLASLDGAEKWELEIRRERELLADVGDAPQEPDEELEANTPPAERMHAA